ncbi:unnamed protein product [Ixodes pacificus]
MAKKHNLQAFLTTSSLTLFQSPQLKPSFNLINGKEVVVQSSYC